MKDKVGKPISFKADVEAFDKLTEIKETSIYEVIRIINRKALFLNEHLVRFFSSGKIIGLKIHLTSDEIKTKLKELIKLNQFETGNIKIVYKILKTKEREKFTFSTYFIKHKYPTQIQYLLGVRATVFKAERKNPNAKVLNTEIRRITNSLISNKNIYEVILKDTEGNITEGSRSNLFFIKGQQVFTSPVSTVLPGITRQKVIEICKNNNIRLIETKISDETLNSFDSAFITGTSPHVLPISKVDNITFDVNNKTLRKIMLLYKESFSFSELLPIIGK